MAVTFRTALLLAVLLIAIRLLWPGDIPFLLDEPKLAMQALNHAEAGQWASYGLRGTRGVDYGPLPLWFYRGLATVTSDLTIWVLLKTLCVSLVTLLAVFWSLRLNPTILPIFAVVPFLSPYLWFYSRDLWDNSFLIPLSALAFTALQAYLMQGKRWQLLVALWSAAACGLVHLMAAPIAILVVLAPLIWGRERLRRDWVVAMVGGAIAVAFACPYLLHLIRQLADSRGVSVWSLGGIGFSLAGFRLMTAWGLEYFFGKQWFFSGNAWLAPLVTVATAVTALPLVVMLTVLIRAVRERIRPSSRSVSRLLILFFILHLGVCVAMGLVSHPHYYNASWFPFWLVFGLIWPALGFSQRWKSRLAISYVVSLALILLVLISRTHVNQGNRELHYGSSLQQLQQIADQTACLPEGSEFLDLRQHPFPESWLVLKKIARCRTGSTDAATTATRGEVIYANAGGADGRLTLRLSDLPQSRP